MKNNESINYSEKEKSDYYIQKSFEYNRKKLKNERRILEIIFTRVNVVRKKMGPEWAYWDMKNYIQDWLNKNKEWLSISKTEHAKITKERLDAKERNATNEME